eukprot:CAMPEP_0170573004 /NCGR_PEP_ID=MMETSP0224-20130122/2529_1 /TAXON_ID=285029 /ORGANISM="Togula jolla, Strain CCCM 725" /LENGTH=1053 /DNA_ID=CAMNT_0010895553 /DNA_START=38 /DNA_END=3199 /DNA_ORIENTATION=-
MEDYPGLYCIVHQGTLVSASASLAQEKHEEVGRLDAGTMVEVVEVLRLPEDQKRVRAKLLEPQGWISLVDLGDTYRWAQRVQLEPEGNRLRSPKAVGNRSVAANALASRKTVDLDEDYARLGKMSLTSSDENLQPPGPSLKDVFEQKHERSLPMLLYIVLLLPIFGGVSLLQLVVWSGMGFGAEALDLLDEGYDYKMFPLALVTVTVLILYLLDFFWPPHLTRQHLVLWDGGKSAGRVIIVILFALVLLAGFLRAKDTPSLPMMFTMLLTPAGMVVVYKATRRYEPLDACESERIFKGKDVGLKMKLLKNIVGEEEDFKRFCIAVFVSFAVVFAIVLILWVIWAFVSERGLEGVDDPSLTAEGRDRIYMLWVTPLAVAICNFVFALFALVRIYMQRGYSETDEVRQKLVAEGLKMTQDVLDHRVKIARSKSMDAVEKELTLRSHYVKESAKHMKQLSMAIRAVGCVFMLTLGVLYAGVQLFYADSGIANMVMMLLGIFFFIFVGLVFVSLKRVVLAMGQWISELPIWKSVIGVKDSPAVRAMILICFLPLAVVIMPLSIVNQGVRRLRGIYSESMEPTDSTRTDASGDQSEMMFHMVKAGQQDFCLTPRVRVGLRKVVAWDWLPIIHWIYILAAVYLCYSICPLLLNVVLSYLGDIFEALDFPIILVLTFIVGIVAFLLPPVPGMTVYIFGGLIVSDACPESMGGFWAGAVINIALCWFLKLAACAVQQKFIGEMLGGSLWVRQTVGVHKTAIRCIESILRRPGLSVGKAAILCGGPDWPTSVLAGVLHLSLFQCELGTIPIIGFVAPCALTGSFYLRQNISSVWQRSANLMIVVSVMVNMILWGLAAWAIQGELEQRGDELTLPLAKNVDLEWLEYRTKQLKAATHFSWEDVSCVVRIIYLMGAILEVVVVQLLYWFSSTLFGSFAVDDKISCLKWYGTLEEEVPGEVCVVFTPSAAAVLVLYFLSFPMYLVYSVWRMARLRLPLQKASEELKKTEASWKTEFIRSAKEAREVFLQNHPSKTPSKTTSIIESKAIGEMPTVTEMATWETSPE